MRLTPGVRLGPYEILALVGAGGMGEVYKARDRRLERTVAVKILPPAVAADPSRLRRFEHEARAIAAVSHPNILAVFDVGTEDVPYLVTELLEGETLREMVARGPVPVKQTIEIARQLVAGLAAAHARGIIHRDLKPDNVLLTTDGLVKILDFGLAKSLASDQSVTRAAETQDGTVLGTAGYMSPEQTRGAVVDHRTDIFACGVVLYELLTGRNPFHRDSAADTLSAVLREVPPDVALQSPAPPALARIIRRSLEKEAEHRFQSAGDVALALEALPAAELAEGKGVAVLPFVSMTADRDNEYFSDGLTEEIIADLAGIRALRVISRTSVMLFKGTRKDVKTIGRELGVRYILEGSVRKAGKNLRITAQLIDAEMDAHLWAEKYNGTVDEIFDVQERVAREIVRALDVTLTADEDRRLAARKIVNPRAFELYVQARQDVRRMAGGPERALALLDTAIQIEGDTSPLRALKAWAKVAQVKAGTNRDLTILDEAEELARSVLALTPTSPDGYAVLGYAACERGRLREAVENLRISLSFEPNDTDALLYLGLSFVYGGQFDRALEVSRQLTLCDPLASLGWMLAGVVQWFPGRFDSAAAPIEHGLELDPHSFMVHWTLGYTYALQGRLDDMQGQVLWLESAGPHVPYTRQLRALFEGINRRRDRARAALAPVDDSALDQHLEFHLAEAYALAAVPDHALDLLRRAVDHGFYPYPFIAEHCPFLAAIRALPQFEQIAERARLRAGEFAAWAGSSPACV